MPTLTVISRSAVVTGREMTTPQRCLKYTSEVISGTHSVFPMWRRWLLITGQDSDTLSTNWQDENCIMHKAYLFWDRYAISNSIPRQEKCQFWFNSNCSTSYQFQLNSTSMRNSIVGLKSQLDLLEIDSHVERTPVSLANYSMCQKTLHFHYLTLHFQYVTFGFKWITKKQKQCVM